MPPSAVAGTDDASDTSEATAISMTINAMRREERAVMKSPLLPNDRTRSSRTISGVTENEGIINGKQV